MGGGGGKRNSCRFLPTVTIGDEKCVIEREEQKLDATVTVGEQSGRCGGKRDFCRP